MQQGDSYFDFMKKMGVITNTENTKREKFPQKPLMTCDEDLIGCVQERNTLNLQCNTELQCTPVLNFETGEPSSVT